MQDFCELCGRNGLTLAHAQHRGISVPSAPAEARSEDLLHFDHAPPTPVSGARVVIFADLLDRARLKRAA
jgi:hypothetical protein